MCTPDSTWFDEGEVFLSGLLVTWEPFLVIGLKARTRFRPISDPNLDL